ncbi:hypothetical protein OLX02_10765 [Novosphingobium sp. KCTC 2891]|uniref:hypothetical protein n=1 Tax=Novosphingobium sp. KCTC 2891 TaxID=2989730 RepID=UPI0022219B2C|nr:hypothetical protein [Novosphingobium sp. KCTC 2891]MCW1383305.1 hypothetical protein [Novosphingobium sp. KCTC 2891]
MNVLRLIVPAAAIVALSACAPTTTRGNDGHGKDVPAARPTGAALSCLPLAQISESRVRDDWTIDFRTLGNKWYRNTLPYRCSGLGFEQAFSYATSQSQLCSTDIITVIQTGTPAGSRGSCGLGQFQPIELVK